MIGVRIGVVLLFVIAGVSKAVQDTLAHHYSTSVFKDATKFNYLFWNPKKSWMNKYKISDGELDLQKERFLGSTTFFVALTDAWHLFQLLHINSLIIGAAVAGNLMEWWVLILLVVVYRNIFELFYRWILRI